MRMICRVALVVLTLATLSCLSSTAAVANPSALKGSIHDPKGDATTLPEQGTPDVKRIWVDYDPVEGVLEVRAALYHPAPTFYRLKSIDIAPDCSRTTFGVSYDAAIGAFPLQLGVHPPVHVPLEVVRRGTHLTHTWSGPPLRGLNLRCVTGGVIGTGVINFAADAFEPFELH